jgi:hypothetical protein
MTFTNWTFYLVVLLVGSFLYLLLIFSYGLFSPFHIFIIWLMYDKFLLTRKSEIIINKSMFCIVPCLGQNILFFTYFILTGDLTTASLDDFYFSWIGIVLLFVTIVEFFILRTIYSKLHRNKK